MKIDAKFITHCLYRAYSSLSADVVSNIFFHDHFESDFLRVTKRGYIHEIEVKISVSDFKADFEKKYREWEKELRGYRYFYKHDDLKTGKTGFKHFWFATPAGLLEHSLIPEHCGLIEICEQGFAREVIKSPQLKDYKKITDRQQIRIDNKYKWAFLNLRRESYSQQYSDTLKHFRELRREEVLEGKH